MVCLFFSCRNVSSAGIEARQALRLKEGVVEALLYLVRGAIDQNHMDNKSVENVICVLRNLSYRCEEVVNPNYDKQPPSSSIQTRATAQHSGPFPSCFISIALTWLTDVSIRLPATACLSLLKHLLTFYLD